MGTWLINLIEDREVNYVREDSEHFYFTFIILIYCLRSRLGRANLGSRKMRPITQVFRLIYRSDMDINY